MSNCLSSVNDSHSHARPSLFHNADGSFSAYRVREGLTIAAMLFFGTLLPLAHSGAIGCDESNPSAFQISRATILTGACLGISVSAFQNLVDSWRNARR